MTSKIDEWKNRHRVNKAASDALFKELKVQGTLGDNFTGVLARYEPSEDMFTIHGHNKVSAKMTREEFLELLAWGQRITGEQ
jgi:hypothetical protein